MSGGLGMNIRIPRGLMYVISNEKGRDRVLVVVSRIIRIEADELKTSSLRVDILFF